MLSHFRLFSPSSYAFCSYEKCEYELYIERVKEFAKLRKQQLLVKHAAFFMGHSLLLFLTSAVSTGALR